MLSVFQANPAFADSTIFRAFGTAYRAALTAAGFVRTADTGQIDWTTVNKPAGSFTMAGYEIWRFDDAAQSSKPIFFKLEYGTGNSASTLGLIVTVGTGSNGSGTITGIFTGMSAVNNVALQGSAAVMPDTWVAGGDGYLASGIFVSSTANANGIGHFAIERSRLADGSVDTTADAGLVLALGYTGSPSWRTVSYDNSWSEQGNAWPGLAPGANIATGSYRGSTYTFPVYPIIGYPRSASRAVASSLYSDVGVNTAFVAPMYGSPHTFRGAGLATTGFGRSSQSIPCLRYE